MLDRPALAHQLTWLVGDFISELQYNIVRIGNYYEQQIPQNYDCSR